MRRWMDRARGRNRASPFSSTEKLLGSILTSSGRSPSLRTSNCPLAFAPRYSDIGGPTDCAEAAKASRKKSSNMKVRIFLIGVSPLGKKETGQELPRPVGWARLVGDDLDVEDACVGS